MGGAGRQNNSALDLAVACTSFHLIMYQPRKKQSITTVHIQYPTTLVGTLAYFSNANKQVHNVSSARSFKLSDNLKMIMQRLVYLRFHECVNMQICPKSICY